MFAKLRHWVDTVKRLHAVLAHAIPDHCSILDILSIDTVYRSSSIQ